MLILLVVYMIVLQDIGDKRMPFTHFWDMHSGGRSKEEWEQIYIEASEEEATLIFYNRFGHNPNRVTCTCCGEDYAISEHKTLGEATSFHRRNKTIKEYSEQEEVLIIRKKDIRPEERRGSLPTQGYVWVD